jgi:ABC-type spermidine/putrescine transport system permease subunit II
MPVSPSRRRSRRAAIERAALVDGANRLQAVVCVVVPLALPGVVATGIFTVIPGVERLHFRPRARCLAKDSLHCEIERTS